jgi:hypothetical protein
MKEIISTIKEDYQGYFFKNDLRNLLNIRKMIKRFLAFQNVNVQLLVNNIIVINNILTPNKTYYYFTIILNPDELKVYHSISNFLILSHFHETDDIMNDVLEDLSKQSHYHL